MICGGANDTSECYLTVLSEDVAFARHFATTLPPPSLPPCRSASGIYYPVKNYLKWQAIQLAIFLTVDA